MWKELFNLPGNGNLYAQAHQQAIGMLDTDWTMFQASVDSLRNSDSGEISVDIHAKDKEVNRAERDIRRKIFTHFSVSGSGDLSSGLALATVVIDIERIGDYTKNIYDLALNHPAKLQAAGLEDRLKTVEGDVTKLFQDMIEAYRNGDLELSRKVMLEYKEGLSAACDGIIKAIVNGDAEGLNATDAGALTLYVHYLKRIASHSRTIVSGLVNPFHRIGYKEKKEL